MNLEELEEEARKLAAAGAGPESGCSSLVGPMYAELERRLGTKKFNEIFGGNTCRSVR